LFPAASALVSDDDYMREVRGLARDGRLVAEMAAASADRRRRLYGGAYSIAYPVVFTRRTRRYERGRGHRACAAGLHRLLPECLDRFEDDVDAALDDLFRHATVPITNLEGWIGSRLVAGSVSWHRRQRGARGALQRPRVTAWLRQALAGDRWLTVLALEILTWVGIPTTAGTSVWPLTAWAVRRAEVTGDVSGSESAVVNDIEFVLRAMRQRPEWYDRYVERPLGRKEPAPLAVDPADSAHESPLLLTSPAMADESRLVELAALAVATIEARIRRGDDLRQAVTEILRDVFGSPTVTGDIGRVPGSTAVDDVLPVLVTDPAVVDRVVQAMLVIVTDDPTRGGH
jgi:hypothetical protein